MTTAIREKVDMAKEEKFVSEQEYLKRAQRWAERNLQDKVSLTLEAIGEAAKETKLVAMIPFKPAPWKKKEILLAEMVCSKIKKLGFKVYARECEGPGGRTQEYCVSWGQNPAIPEGFESI